MKENLDGEGMEIDSAPWVSRLQAMLVDRAIQHFADAVVDRETFVEYVRSAAFIPSVKENFILESYALYLQKVNASGEELTDRLQ